VLQLTAAVDVLAHGSDPIAVLGIFGPALVIVALVTTLVVRDRRRRAPDDDQRVSPPRAD
jgi:hypothetical protein